MSAEDFDREAKLRALKKLRNKRLDEKQKDYFKAKKQKSVRSDDYKSAIGKDGNAMKVKGSVEDATPKKMVVKGSTEKISTRETTPLTSKGDYSKMKKDLEYKQRLKGSLRAAEKAGDTKLASAFAKKLSSLGSIAKRGLKMLPIVGGVAAALSSGDASAAVPGLDMADDIGPEKGSLQRRLEDGTATPEDHKKLRAMAAKNMAKRIK